VIWLAIVVVVAFALGYATRHYRPFDRIDTWAWDQDRRRLRDLREGSARRRPGWYGAQAVFAVELAVAFVIQPRATVSSVRQVRAQRRLNPRGSRS
jgi:hypothetical protein